MCIRDSGNHIVALDASTGTVKWDTALAPPGVGYFISVSYTHLRAHETDSYLVCRLLRSTLSSSSAAADVYKRQRQSHRRARRQHGDGQMGYGARSAGSGVLYFCLLYTSPSPRDGLLSRMPSSEIYTILVVGSGRCV